MANSVADLRSIAVCGHSSAGKTTIVDHVLVHTGAVKSKPCVDEGTSVCDFDEEEKHHKHSIESTCVHCEHGGKFLHLLDTPGYPDLLGQTVSALRAADNALIVIDAHAGIKVNTRRVWKEAEKAGLGRILCLTKLDTENIDFPALIDAIHEVFGVHCVLFNVPRGLGAQLNGVIDLLEVPTDVEGALLEPHQLHESLVEAIVESDDALMEKYFEGEMPTTEQLAELTVRAIQAGTLVPIVCVAGKQDIGIGELLNVLSFATLSPADVQRQGEREGDKVTLPADAAAPLSAQVFRTRIDPFVQKLSFIRVVSGTLRRDDPLHVLGNRKGIKIGSLLRVQGEKTEAIDEAVAGDIVAIAKCEELHTGTSIGEVGLPPIDFPTPMVGLAIEPKNRGDEAKLAASLHKLTEEDPTIHLEHDPETKEMVLTGMSELHLQLVQERLKRRDKVEMESHEPRIPYRETITSSGEGEYRHKKQSGGAGQFAEVHIRVFPFPETETPDSFATKDRFPQMKHVHYHDRERFLWIDSIVGGSIPGNFMPAVEKGFLERLKQGVIAGCPIQNICVEVHFGKDHPVDSNETAFKMAANRALAGVFKTCRPALLEPVVNLHISVPADNVGDVSSDLSGRRGQMVGMDSGSGGMTTIEARAPLAEVATYARTLSSMTGGQGAFTMEFSQYETVPPNVQQQIIAAAKVTDEED